ncbi:AfsR/SARP family transcriptional regulator [Rhodococcus sp. 14-2470-1b]|uniref:AfsR/SARP family transcriptional regulator n=1 Tax=Rhodococcus sp. 14-2470-1b TaxID=2023149 RepID=UPI00113FCFE7|nr:AfsR/SARP family transcriptional regulator [Rhodococcus sp. 14-2470-1b]
MVQVGLLGPVEIIVDSQNHPISGRLQRTLLSVLAANAGEVVAKTQLLEELWGSALPAAPGNALHAQVHRLRRTIRSLMDNDAGNVLATCPDGYKLQIDKDSVDLHRFDRLVATARSLPESHSESAIQMLDDALALFRGRTLQGVTGGPICQSICEHYDEEKLSVHERRIVLSIATCGSASAISDLRRLTLQNPWRERVVELLMLSLYREGRQIDAIKVYEGFRRRIVEEFAVEPSPNLKRCLKAILNQDPEILAVSA